MSFPLTRHYTLAALLAGGGALLMAQGTQAGTMTATVVDKAGAPIAGAELRLTSPSLQGERVLRTDASGHATARLLPPGAYRILVKKEGFSAIVLNERIALEQTYSPRIALTSEATAVVEIVASAGGVEKSESKTAFNYTKESMDVLPIVQGSALDAAYLSPGVAKSVMSDKGCIEIRGANGTGSLTLVDGQNTMDNVYVGQRLKINMDDVEETQVLTGAIPAEYGYVEGGVVNSITKSGGNEFSGSLRVNLANQAWNAVTPVSDRTAILNKTQVEKSIGVGGPIVKDRLWFYASYFNTAPSTAKSLDGSVGQLPVTNYSEIHGDYRREVKLTYSPWQEHTFSLSWHNFRDSWNRDASGAGELGALSMFHMQGEFYTLAYRGMLGSDASLSVKVGTKKQEYSSSVNPQAWGPPIYNNEDLTTYASGAWDPADPQPDVRDNRTINIKYNRYFSLGGSHDLSLGYDYYEGITKSSGYQSAYYVDVPGVGRANVVTYSVDQWNGLTRTGTYLTPDNGGAGAGPGYPFGGGNGLTVQVYVPDTNTMKTNGFYFNDTYTPDTHWSFNIGARFDSYNDTNLSKGKVASNTGFSPRLGAKYDVNGDGAWVLGLAFSRLLGRPLETTFQSAGYVFSPITYGFTNLLAAQAESAGQNLSFPVAQIYDLASYDTAHPTVQDAVFNVKVDPKLRMTTVDEWQASLAYTFHDTPLGKGYLRVNLVRKDWGNLVARRQGVDGTVTSPVYGTQEVTYFYNEPQAHREYRALELDFSTQIRRLRIGGNATWSTIYGNYNSDAGTSYPGQIPIYYNYPIDPVSGATIYDPRNFGGLNGLLQGRIAGAAPRNGGMSPLQFNILGDYYLESFLGKTSIGLVYQFRSGQAFDISRNANPSAFANYSGQGSFGGATQVLGTPGSGVYGSSSILNMAITQDFKLWKYKGDRTVNGWIRLGVTNLWNHQQILTWDTTYQTTNDLNAPWQPKNANFGQPTRISDFATPRTLDLSVGLRF